MKPITITREMAAAFKKAHDDHAALPVPKVYAAGQREEANIIAGLRAALEATSGQAAETTPCQHAWSAPDASGIVECLWCRALAMAPGLKPTAAVHGSGDAVEQIGSLLFLDWDSQDRREGGQMEFYRDMIRSLVAEPDNQLVRLIRPESAWPRNVLNRERTLEVLTQHNAWRRGAEGEQTDPRLLGLALDAAIAFIRATRPSPESVANTPIDELIARYTADGCDFADIAFVRKAALRYVSTMEDSQARCVLYVLATKPTQQATSATTATLIDLLRQRDAHGLAKYGVTLDRTDLTLPQWLQHMTEEMLDGAGYAQAALRVFNELQRSAPAEGNAP